jgi:hypothetical protein
MLRLGTESAASIPTADAGYVNLYINSTTGRWEYKNSSGVVVPGIIDVDEQSPAAASTVTVTIARKVTVLNLTGLTSGNSIVDLGNGTTAGDTCLVTFTAGASGNHDLTLKNQAGSTVLASLTTFVVGHRAAAMLIWNGTAWIVQWVTYDAAPAVLSGGVIIPYVTSSTTVIYKPSDTTRTGGSYTIDPDLQIPLAAGVKISGKMIISLGGNDSGSLGLIAPTGCTVSATFLDGGPLPVAGGTEPIAAPLGFVATDASALEGLALTFVGTTGVAHQVIILFWVKNGSTAGNFGMAFNGNGGSSTTVQAGSCLESTLSA